MACYFSNRAAIVQKAKALLSSLVQYTHAITDFAPVLPTAMQIARRKRLAGLPPLFHISHHAAMHSRNRDTPRPLKVDRLTYWATQRYLDSISGDINIGFHFEAYNSDILTPPISEEMLNALPTFDSNIVIVYLNGAPHFLAEQCSKIDPDGDHEWHIYSALQSETKQTSRKHVWLFPLDASFRRKLPHCRAVVTTCGFMGPAELIHLGKPFERGPSLAHRVTNNLG